MGAFVEKRPIEYMKLRERAAAGRLSEFRWGAYIQTCSTCGATDLPEDFEFCGNCGTALEDTE